jgi:hypothetical protein
VTLAALLCSFAVCFGCSHGAPAHRAFPGGEPAPPAQPARGPYEGELVVAEVEQLERRAHEEWLDDGSVWVSNVVAFGIVAPKRFDTMLFAHVLGHPRIDGRPLLLGDQVTFILPVNWRNRDLSLEELEELDFAETE